MAGSAQDPCTPPQPEPVGSGEFSRQGCKRKLGSLPNFGPILRNNGNWWLTPIVPFLLLVADLVMLCGTAAAPFIYT